jgi:hypothetical protein
MRATLLGFLLLLAVPALADDRWVAGDLHEHVSPPDATREVSATFSGCLAAAKELGIEFLVFTPHLREDWWKDEAQARRAVKGLADLVARARDEKEICAIPGFEDTRFAGHVGVSFVDSDALTAVLDAASRTRSRGALLAELTRHGCLLTINHPLAGGNRKAALSEFASDLSWKAWTKGEETDDSRAIESAATCVETLNAAASFAEAALGTPREERLVWKTFARLDRVALESGRRYAPVGGSDNHAFWLVATTWARVPKHGGPPTLTEVREALVKGRTCVAGPDASSLRARVAKGAWKGIGDDLAADGADVEVRFDGKGELFLDGRSLGTFEGGTTLHPRKGERHHLRLVRESSFSGYIWIDWDRPHRVYR